MDTVNNTINREAIIKSELANGVGMVIFFKSNGAIRPMLCTRSASLCKRLTGLYVGGVEGHQNRQKAGSGNISVIDLEIGELRSFNVHRIVNYKYIDVTCAEQFEEVLVNFREYVARYTKVVKDNGNADVETACRKSEKLKGTAEISHDEIELTGEAVDDMFGNI